MLRLPILVVPLQNLLQGIAGRIRAFLVAVEGEQFSAWLVRAFGWRHGSLLEEKWDPPSVGVIFVGFGSPCWENLHNKSQK